MTADVGLYAARIAALVSLASAVALFYGGSRGRMTVIRAGKGAFLASTGFVVVSSLSLLYLLISRDFRIAYVYEHSDRQLSLPYTISAFWAGPSGSLLFWTLVLSMLGTAFLTLNRRDRDGTSAYAAGFIASLQAFFLFLCSFLLNPFLRLPHAPHDGLGLNPLLRNPEMLFHPPCLYLGYAGFSIPFALAMGALMKGPVPEDILDRIRGWMLFSWSFLTLGNVLGAQWAYVELGWGGYWAWDPVENASLMPWLTATASIHSSSVWRRTGALRGSSLVFLTLTFLLTIFGIFITRSGVLSSVHAYGSSPVGGAFLISLGAISVLSASLLALRWKADGGLPTEEGTAATVVTLMNLAIAFMVAAIFFGTLFPLASELISGERAELGRAFFNRASIPA